LTEEQPEQRRGGFGLEQVAQVRPVADILVEEIAAAMDCVSRSDELMLLLNQVLNELIPFGIINQTDALNPRFRPWNVSDTSKIFDLRVGERCRNRGKIGRAQV
jgi:hypothetical protein